MTDIMFPNYNDLNAPVVQLPGIMCVKINFNCSHASSFCSFIFQSEKSGARVRSFKLKQYVLATFSLIIF